MRRAEPPTLAMRQGFRSLGLHQPKSRHRSFPSSSRGTCRCRASTRRCRVLARRPGAGSCTHRICLNPEKRAGAKKCNGCVQLLCGFQVRRNSRRGGRPVSIRGSGRLHLDGHDSTCRDRSKPSGRAWARALGVSHQKLVRKFTADPNAMWRLQVAKGDPRFTELSRAQEYSRQMRERGELRGELHLSRRFRSSTRCCPPNISSVTIQP
jgi:hypothetical protein